MRPAHNPDLSIWKETYGLTYMLYAHLEGIQRLSKETYTRDQL